MLAAPGKSASLWYMTRKTPGKIADEIISRINRIWEERKQITPSYTERKPPQVIEIFKLLPRTNCRQCGYLTCMAFAADLSQSKVTTEACPPLCQPEYSANKERIASLFTAS